MKSGSGSLVKRRLTATAAARPSRGALSNMRDEVEGGDFLSDAAGSEKGTPGSTDVQTLRHLMSHKSFLGIFFLGKHPQRKREDGCFRDFLTAWLTAAVWAGVDLPTPHLTHSRAPGGRPHGPGMTKPTGCSRPSLGAWPFRVIDQRSKRHFLRRDLWRRRHGWASLRAYTAKTILYCWDHNQSDTYKHTCLFSWVLVWKLTWRSTRFLQINVRLFPMFAPSTTSSINNSLTCAAAEGLKSEMSQ